MSGIVELQTITLVTILTNNYLLRLGLQKLVDEAKSIRLVGHAAHSDNLDEILANEQPHIVILDTEIGGGAPELIRKIKRAAPRIKTILLSGFDDIEYSRQALAAGADGIVLKVQPSAVLLATINYLAHSRKAVALPIDHASTQLQLNHSPAILAPPSPSPAPFLPHRLLSGLRLSPGCLISRLVRNASGSAPICSVRVGQPRGPREILRACPRIRARPIASSYRLAAVWIPR